MILIVANSIKKNRPYDKDGSQLTNQFFNYEIPICDL